MSGFIPNTKDEAYRAVPAHSSWYEPGLAKTRDKRLLHILLLN